MPPQIILLILGWGLLGTVIVRAITSERPAKNSVQEKPRSDLESRKGQNGVPNGPSSDFSALISVIRAEGAAYRGEENREDKGKRFRDYLTLGALVLTAVGVYWQVSEMIKVYEPIREQAEAAIKQAETVRNETVANHRAWIDSPSATIFRPVSKQRIRIDIIYDNIGHSPAGVFFYINDHTFTKADWNSRWSVFALSTLKDYCMNIDTFAATTTVWPGTPIGSYTAHYGVIDKEPEIGARNYIYSDEIERGDEIFSLTGCLVYSSLGAIRHTSFCYYYLPGKSEPPKMYICASGNAAD